jgi:AcrR family transcriptional regulator
LDGGAASLEAVPAQPSARSLRRDAQRNRELVLSSAERVFAERGLDATLEEVAAGAGVGVGTIYRRFPSKDALLEAVFERRLDASAELLTECMARASAWDGLREFLNHSLRIQSDDRGLHEFLYTLDTSRDRFARLRARVEPPLTQLIERAKAEGKLRSDFRATDVPLLILMLSRLAHTDRAHGPAMARRYLELLLKGLAPGPDPAPVTPPVDDDTLGTWLAALAAKKPRDTGIS